MIYEFSNNQTKTTRQTRKVNIFDNMQLNAPILLAETSDVLVDFNIINISFGATGFNFINNNDSSYLDITNVHHRLLITDFSYELSFNILTNEYSSINNLTTLYDHSSIIYAYNNNVI